MRIVVNHCSVYVIKCSARKFGEYFSRAFGWTLTTRIFWRPNGARRKSQIHIDRRKRPEMKHPAGHFHEHVAAISHDSKDTNPPNKSWDWTLNTRGPQISCHLQNRIFSRHSESSFFFAQIISFWHFCFTDYPFFRMMYRTTKKKCCNGKVRENCWIFLNRTVYEGNIEASWHKNENKNQWAKSNFPSRAFKL